MDDTGDRHRARILELLDGADGMSVTEVADALGLNRNSTARYLDVLHKQGYVAQRRYGRARVYRRAAHEPYAVQVELFRRAMDAASCGITIADATRPDLPLVYVNDAFCELTGYARDEVIGRNCRFLQGDDRDQAALESIRAALRDGREVTATLTNYRKDGTPFRNELRLAPFRNDAGRLTHFVGIQTRIE